MKIRLTRQYLQWSPGSVVNLASGVARTLIAAGKATEVDESEGQKILRAPRNKAVRQTEVKHGA